MSRHTCSYRFIHPAHPRPLCGGTVVSTASTSDKHPLCLLHDPYRSCDSEAVTKAFKKALLAEHHWLEGVLLSGMDLSQLYAYRARIPFADFEGSCLTKANFAEALLEGAVFRSAQAVGALFPRSQLSGATMVGCDLTHSNLAYARLADADLEGAQLDKACLFGAEILPSTSLVAVSWGVLGEYHTRQYDRAARVYRDLANHFAGHSDNAMADRFYYSSMRAQHELASAASPWKRIGWLFHRYVWGYGIHPMWTIYWMIATISFFGCGLYPMLGVQKGTTLSHSVLDGMALSVVTFATLGYGNSVPAGPLGELIGGIEALLGTVLTSTFLVSLATKYVRRS